jgi:hypothetical protein
MSLLLLWISLRHRIASRSRSNIERFALNPGKSINVDGFSICELFSRGSLSFLDKLRPCLSTELDRLTMSNPVFLCAHPLCLALLLFLPVPSLLLSFLSYLFLSLLLLLLFLSLQDGVPETVLKTYDSSFRGDASRSRPRGSYAPYGLCLAERFGHALSEASHLRGALDKLAEILRGPLIAIEVPQELLSAAEEVIRMPRSLEVAGGELRVSRTRGRGRLRPSFGLVLL